MIMLTVLMGLELTQMPYSCASLSISIQQHTATSGITLRYATRLILALPAVRSCALALRIWGLSNVVEIFFSIGLFLHKNPCLIHLLKMAKLVSLQKSVQKCSVRNEP